MVTAVAVKIIRHGVDAAFLDAPVGGPASFGKRVIDMDDVAVEIRVFAVMVIQVAAFLAFGQSPVFVSREFFLIQPGDEFVGSFPTAPFTSFLIAVFFQPHQFVFGIGKGAIPVIRKTLSFSHLSNPIKLLVSRCAPII